VSILPDLVSTSTCFSIIAAVSRPFTRRRW
jgi:hypothetical protein